MADTDINLSTFGMAIAAASTNGLNGCNAGIDFVRITVTYTGGAVAAVPVQQVRIISIF